MPTAQSHTCLHSLLADLPQIQDDTSFGQDINAIHELLLSSSALEDAKQRTLRGWIGRWQPCLFGRLASHESRGLAVDMVWIHEHELAEGYHYVTDKIQSARRAWKDRAELGLSSGFLVMFNSSRLARAAPSETLVEVCCELSNLYLVEHAPIQPDVIYTEAVPLRRGDGQLTLFKAGCNIFYPGAHLTRNHDRRIPGGLLFSMNSPGHYANSLALRGLTETLEEAIAWVRETALRSIGNGGIGHPEMQSTSWHNRTQHPDAAGASSPHKRRPAYIPHDLDDTRYTALYHTDVLVPTDVTSDGETIESGCHNAELWRYLILDYITTAVFPSDHVNYALFHGAPIEDCAKYHNPWSPRVAHNEELFEY